MREQEHRDEQSVQIFIGLCLGGLVVGVAFVLLLFADAFGMSDETTNALGWASAVGGVVTTIVYVHRHRRA